jgi:hypothetical protein
MTEAPEELVAAAVQEYDLGDPVALQAAVLRRLSYRLARSGKVCERDGLERPLSAFSRDSRNPDGLRRYCRECAAKGYRKRNRTYVD